LPALPQADIGPTLRPEDVMRICADHAARNVRL
jgi:hypothetical protein